jgi:hypothetical protein
MTPMSLDEFVIDSRQDARCIFHSRTHLANGWLDSYSIDLEASDFRASALIANLPHGTVPSGFFAKLACQWAGWTGKEEWRSAEGELEITATSDRTGHINLVFALVKPEQSANWSASAHLIIEAGRLEQLSWEAQRFFDALR